MYYAREQKLHPSAAETANGNGAWLTVEEYLEAQILINVSALSGTTPSIQFFLDYATQDGSIVGTHPASFANITATGVYQPTQGNLTGLGYQVRLRWTIGGTGGPSVTFDGRIIAKGHAN